MAGLLAAGTDDCKREAALSQGSGSVDVEASESDTRDSRADSAMGQRVLSRLGEADSAGWWTAGSAAGSVTPRVPPRGSAAAAAEA